MLGIPIYRARKIDKYEYVEGWLTKVQNVLCIEIDNMPFEIDPSTLVISFDGGKNWFEFLTVRAMINEVTGLTYE